MKGEGQIMRMGLIKSVRFEPLREMRKSVIQVSSGTFHTQGTPPGRSVLILDTNSTGSRVRREEEK